MSLWGIGQKSERCSTNRPGAETKEKNMPVFNGKEAKLYYEILGNGPPILLLAPGGMRSSGPFWDKVPWNPVKLLAKDYTLIVMDQRNAGKS